MPSAARQAKEPRFFSLKKGKFVPFGGSRKFKAACPGRARRSSGKRTTPGRWPRPGATKDTAGVFPHPRRRSHPGRIRDFAARQAAVRPTIGDGDRLSAARRPTASASRARCCSHPAFEELRGGPGVALVDLAYRDQEYYGRVVNAHCRCRRANTTAIRRTIWGWCWACRRAA